MIQRMLLLGIMVIALLASSVTPVLAWTTSNLAILGIREDYFYNYDFCSSTVSDTNVDWPVTMLFYNNAEVDKVKNIYWGVGPWSTCNARLNDGSGWVWDVDRGTKSTGLHACHMRVYADADDRMYNVDWGYYVLGTSHYDYFEWTPWGWSGYSESAEAELCQVARDKGYTVFEDWAYFYNYEGYREEGGGKHRWSNNGWASAVNVP